MKMLLLIPDQVPDPHLSEEEINRFCYEIIARDRNAAIHLQDLIAAGFTPDQIGDAGLETCHNAGDIVATSLIYGAALHIAACQARLRQSRRGS